MKRLGLVVAGVASVVATMIGVSSGADAGTTTPVVSAVSPEHGPVGGGTLVTISGSNLFGATSVTFGGTPAASVINLSNSRLQAVSPAGSAGATVDIEVTTAQGTSTVSAADQFTYVTTPAIQSVRPRLGSTRGHNLVAISGSDFVGVSAVSFGGQPALAFTVVSPNAIAAVSPPGVVGTVDISVTATDGTTPIDPADRFSYVLRVPVVTSVVFDVGNEAGGDGVTITGTGFLKGATVYFGTTPATDVQYVGPNTLTATSPAGTGIVDVTVVTRRGASVINQPMDEYEYTPTGP